MIGENYASSRLEAKEKGLTKFFTGKECVHGHISIRYTASGNCDKCVSIRSKENRKTKEYKLKQQIKKESRKPLTKDIVLKHLNYSENTGTFTWIKNGKIAGCLDSHASFLVTRIDDVLYFNHKLVFLVENGYMPKYIRHIDRNKMNNKISNLSECVGKEGSKSEFLSKNNKSGFKGAHYNKKNKKWMSSIRINYKSKHIGLYDNKIDAVIAYDEMALKVFGELARTNKSMGLY